MSDTRQPIHVIGLDLGTTTGWAVLRSDGWRELSGDWDLSVRKGEGAGMRPLRLRRYLIELLNAYTESAEHVGLPLIAYELIEKHVVKGRTNTYAAQTYGGLRDVLLSLLEARGHDRYVGVRVADVKRTATGKGNAGKPAMQAAARSQWNRMEVGEDEADALWVAEAARRAALGVSA